MEISGSLLSYPGPLELGSDKQIHRIFENLVNPQISSGGRIMIITKKGKSIYVNYDFQTELNKIIKQWIVNEYVREFYKQNFQN